MSAPPWRQADRLAIATQAGYLSLLGIRQKDTTDPLLFPLFKQDLALGEGENIPCQVVHADAENYWTLTRGQLQLVQATLDPMLGPRLVKRGTSIPLGTLLHAVQTHKDADGRTTLFLTTQADEHPTCLCSAVDAEDGKIVWQRQLGVLPRQAPREIAGQIILPDAQGLMLFDPSKPSAKASEPWRRAGALARPTAVDRWISCFTYT